MAPDLRTIKTLNIKGALSNSEEDPRSWLNDRGQIAFVAEFTNNTSGVFVSNAVALPDGDFNADLLVSAADYAVWRDTAGGLDLYDEWVAGFQPPGEVAAATVAVPEPGSVLLAVVACVGGCCRRR
ncbi:MAG: hypothetical protein AAGG46_03050 [Planctomycetota bacterium]